MCWRKAKSSSITPVNNSGTLRPSIDGSCKALADERSAGVFVCSGRVGARLVSGFVTNGTIRRLKEVHSDPNSPSLVRKICHGDHRAFRARPVEHLHKLFADKAFLSGIVFIPYGCDNGHFLTADWTFPHLVRLQLIWNTAKLMLRAGKRSRTLTGKSKSWNPIWIIQLHDNTLVIVRYWLKPCERGCA
jgi:hypothetical protein